MRISSFTILPAVICCVLLLPACSSKNSEATPKPGAPPAAIAVNGIVVQSGPLENVVRSTGTVLASESVDLAVEVAGRIEHISFTEGGHVKKNDLLVQLTDDDLQAQKKKVELQIHLATELEQRQKQLFEKNLLSKEQYDIAANNLATLQSDYDNLAATARKKEIRAPFDGIIGLRYVSEGAYVAPATRVASIQKVNPLKVDFSIPEKYSGKVSVGDPVSFNSPESNLEFTGKVFAVEPKIDPATRTLQIRALAGNNAEKIFPGSYVQIELHLKQISNAIMVPTEAVIPVLNGQTVYARKNGVAVSIPVQTGVRTSSSVQITQGLTAGDTVLTSGILQVRPGMPVNVKIQ